MLNQKADEIFNPNDFSDFWFIMGFDGETYTPLIRSKLFTLSVIKDSTFCDWWSFCVAGSIAEGKFFCG